MNAAETAYNAALEAFKTQRFELAERYAMTALDHAPHYAHPYNILGMVAQMRGHANDALRHYTEAMRRRPDFAEAISNAANILENIGRTDAAEALYRRATQLQPGLAPAWYNLGSILRDRGDYQGARALYRKAAQLTPDNPNVGIGLIYALDMDPDAGPDEALQAKQAWYEKFRLPHLPARKYQSMDDWADHKNPERRLKIAYVSADFRQHSASYAFGPIVTGHGDRFDVTLYSNSGTRDQITQWYQQQPQITWKDVSGFSDQEFAWLVFRDDIDILIDLGGYTSGSRVRAMTAQPAPVQFHGWGYILPLGIPEIQHQFTDDIIGDWGLGIGCLPCAFHFRPPAEAPAIGTSPAARNGYVTFGYLGRYSRVTAETAEAWADILRRVPGSKLILKDRAFAHPSRTAMVALRFPKDVRDRLDFMSLSGLRDHLDAHNLVDICLDPFPVGGGVTVLEALHMGCPVVTLKGERPVSRAGASILNAVGGLLPSMIARNAAEYVSIAQAIASGNYIQGEAKNARRAKFSKSIICNTPAYVAHVERAYRSAWRLYCATK